MRSLGHILDENKGIAPGFDALRLWLALSVLWFHSFVIVGTMNDIESTTAWFYIYAIMPMFFALSGFLVAGSALRLTQQHFLINRFCRILPALAVQTLIAALLIGPLFTDKSITDYASDPRFTRYFANLILWIQYELPGTFTTHPSNAINQSIWSIPFEVTCYAVIMATMLFKSSKRYSPLMALIVAGLLIIPVLFQSAGLVLDNGKTEYTLLNYAFFTRGSLLFPSFLMGTLFYWLRYQIPFSPKIAISCLCVCLALALIGTENLRHFYWLNLISIPLLVYLTTFIGCCKLPKIPLYSRGDYSYGIYIFGYPLQQILLALFPTLLGHWLPHFIGSIIITTMAAMLSWHTIEKPILMLRKKHSMATSHLKITS